MANPLPPAKKKHIFGMFTLLSLEKSDFGMLAEHQGPEVAMELLGQSSNLSLDPLPPAKTKHTFGMFMLLSPEKSDFGMHALAFHEHENELGKHGLCFIGPENDFCVNPLFS